MANEVEQILVDAQRALRDRGVAFRTAITEVMSKHDEAMAVYIERLNEINAARFKLDEEAVRAFEQLRDKLTHQQSTLVLARDMHPVLAEEQKEEVPGVTPPKQLVNGHQHSRRK